MTRADLLPLVIEAITFLGGRGTIVQIGKYIWDNHEQKLRESGDFFYRWQYDMRWAGQYLRDTGVLVEAKKEPRGI